MLQHREDAANNYGVSVQLASYVLRGLQYIRFGSEQDEGVDAGGESGIDGHDATLTRFCRFPMRKLAVRIANRHCSCDCYSENGIASKIPHPSAGDERTLQILFVGDVFGSAGRRIVREHLTHVIAEHGVDLVVINAENAAGGFGVTPAIADDLFDLGAHVLTTGNHVWDKREIIEYMQSAAEDSDARARRVIRPANFVEGTPGFGFYEGELANGQAYAVIDLQGRVFMAHSDDPFRTADALLKVIKARVIVVDFHAEATSEKAAMGWYLDGRVTAVLGTHTHVPTADDRVLPGGTAYQTDVGMSGPYDSVIGVEKEMVLQRFLTGMPGKFEAAKGDPRMAATLIECDGKTGRAISTRRLLLGE